VNHLCQILTAVLVLLLAPVNANTVINGQRVTVDRDLSNKADRETVTSTASLAVEYDLNPSEFLKAAKPLIKLVPPSLRAQLLAGSSGVSAPDFCPYIQKGLELYRVVDLQGLQVNCKTGLKISGFQVLMMNGGRLWANLTDQGEAVFSPKTVAAGQPIVIQFYLQGFGSITGSATVFSMKQAYVVGNGISFKMNNIVSNGLTRRLGTRWIDAELVDFVQITNSTYSNYDQAFRFSVPPRSSRANTQIVLDGIGGRGVNSVGYIDNTLLARINIDAASVGGGIVIGPNNGQLVFDRTHIESVAFNAGYVNLSDEAASYSKYGWGIYILDGNSQQGEIIFNSGSVFGGVTAVGGSRAALGGIYIGKNDNGTTRPGVTFRDFYIAPTSPGVTQWIPLEAHYNFRWEGKWISSAQSGVRIGNSGRRDFSIGDLFLDAVIDEGQYSRRGTKNLLPGTKFSNLTETNEIGTVSVDDLDSTRFDGAQKVTFKTSSSAERYRTVSLGIGWHTFLISGDSSSSHVFASVRSNKNDIIMRKSFLNNSTLYPITFHMPVYIPANGDYRIGIQAASNGSAIIDEIGFVKGLWPGDVPAGAWTYPPVLTLPACSARYEGRGLTLIGKSDDNHVSICVNSTGGYVWKKVG
jgi:hypothetical protein